jgi:hypothetical protein
MYQITRNLGLGRYRTTGVMGGLENSVALNTIYGNKLKEILNTTCVDVVSKPWQIWVDRETKRITITKEYLSETESGTLYLDFVHEMIHIWQITKGKDVFDRSVSYVDAPTEIEAYRYTIEDAKRIGFSRKDIVDYLKVRWITDEEHSRLVKAVLG